MSQEELNLLIQKATESLSQNIADQPPATLDLKEGFKALSQGLATYLKPINPLSKHSLVDIVLPASSILTSPPTAMKKEKNTKTSGSQWFDMPAIEMTEELKKDLSVLQSRGALDPKRHYRKEKIGATPFIAIGTVIEGPTEYYSAR